MALTGWACPLGEQLMQVSLLASLLRREPQSRPQAPQAVFHASEVALPLRKVGITRTQADRGRRTTVEDCQLTQDFRDLVHGYAVCCHRGGETIRCERLSVHPRRWQVCFLCFELASYDAPVKFKDVSPISVQALIEPEAVPQRALIICRSKVVVCVVLCLCMLCLCVRIRHRHPNREAQHHTP